MSGSNKISTIDVEDQTEDKNLDMSKEVNVKEVKLK